jgi:hypothetical protein
VVCRGGVLGPLCSDGHMGLDRGLAFGWVAAWSCAGSEFVDLAGSTSGNAIVGLAVTSGRRPRRHGAWVATWRSVWTARMSTRLVRLRAMRRSLCLVSRGGGPEARVVFSCVGDRMVWIAGPSFVQFFVSIFPYKSGNVCFFNPISLIKWVILHSFYLIGRQVSTALNSKK